MDIKIKGLSYDILIEALNQARDGRLHIYPNYTIKEPNVDVKAHAPKMITKTIPGDYIGPYRSGVKTFKNYKKQVVVRL